MNSTDLDAIQRRLRDAVELIESEADALRRDTRLRARDPLAAQAIGAAAAMVEDDALRLIAEVRTMRAGDDLDLNAIEARATTAGEALRWGMDEAGRREARQSVEDVPALVAEVRTLRAERDRLRDAARGHVLDPENYITPLRPQIRALRDAILSDDAGVSR